MCKRLLLHFLSNTLWVVHSSIRQHTLLLTLYNGPINHSVSHSALITWYTPLCQTNIYACANTHTNTKCNPIDLQKPHWQETTQTYKINKNCWKQTSCTKLTLKVKETNVRNYKWSTSWTRESTPMSCNSIHRVNRRSAHNINLIDSLLDAIIFTYTHTAVKKQC